MKEAAEGERFEEAARYRNRLFSIRHLAERQGADKRAVGTVDVIGLAVEGARAAVQVFPLRDGRLIDRYAFHLENVAGQDSATILESFCLEYYGGAPAVQADATASEQRRLRRVEALEQLREALNLESLPLRVECFDISNLQGREIVGSMTVFEDGQPKRAHYRSFGV